jgi:hypothetical protein
VVRKKETRERVPFPWSEKSNVKKEAFTKMKTNVLMIIERKKDPLEGYSAPLVIWQRAGKRKDPRFPTLCLAGKVITLS